MSDELEEQRELLGTRELELRTLTDEIGEKIAQIQRLYKSIAKLEFSVQSAVAECDIFSAAIGSLQSAPHQIEASVSAAASGRSSRSSRQSANSEGDPVLSKHAVKLEGKRREVHAVESELESLKREAQSWQSRLSELYDEEIAKRSEILSARNKAREFDVRYNESARRLALLREEERQRSRDVAELHSLEQEARRTLAKLESQEAKFGEMEDGRDELTKEIESMENQLLAIEADMAPVRRRMFVFKDHALREVAQLKHDRETHKNSANWEAERAGLLETLRQLRDDIKIAKRTQHRNLGPAPAAGAEPLSFEDQERYWRVWKRWESDLADAPAQGPIDDIWASIMESRIDLAQLIGRNQKKAEGLARINEQIKRAVDRIQSQESKHCVEDVKQREAFEAEEKELVQKIKAMKIRLAQWRLDHPKLGRESALSKS
jgi:chromosome segregation ATPase